MRNTKEILLVSLLSAVACTEPEQVEFGTADVGEACVLISDCKAGLACTANVCATLPPIEEGPQRGDPCTTDLECGSELVCGRQGVCATTKGLAAGEECGLTENCAAPLLCHGVTGKCATDDGSAGTLTFGESCKELLDCARPYVCGLNKTCDKVPLYLGPSCERADADVGVFRMHFELPETVAAVDDGDFYRHPFPSDLRVVNGRPSLAGHPAPESILGLSLKDAYFRAIEEDTDGFAPNQPVFLRFSDPLNRDTLCLDPGSKYPDDGTRFCTPTADASIYLVNVDADSPRYKNRYPLQLAYGTKAGQYICQNWVGVAPLDGRPLEHGTTYAVVVTTAVKDLRGVVPTKDRDFQKILSGELAAPSYEPLKAWITAAGVDVATIAGATVFTVGNPDRHAQSLRQAVHAGAAPTFGNAVLCNGVNRSPCEDGLTGVAHQRGCVFSASNTFDVLDGTYVAPAFQGGTRPYTRTQDGGKIDWGTGVPASVGNETMCFSVATPKTPTPAGGFPVVIYGHGTGGSYTSFLQDGTAKKLTDLGYAVVSFDNVQHGRRQQPFTETADPSKWVDPGNVFFNLANPRASRDNIHQGTADLFHLVRIVRNPATQVTGRPAGAVKFDPAKVMYYGHSQGTIISPEFLATEPDLAAALMTGAGAELALSILNKKSPIDSSAVAGLFFGDRNLTRIHPMMGVFSMIFAEADSVAFAHRWVLDPALRGGRGLPLLHVMGVGDSFTPDQTQGAQLRASGFSFVGSVDVPVDGVSSVASPAKNNLNGVTAAAIQATPDGAYDGHFVGFRHPSMVAAIRRFFETAKAGAPEIAK